MLEVDQGGPVLCEINTLQYLEIVSLRVCNEQLNIRDLVTAQQLLESCTENPFGRHVGTIQLRKFMMFGVKGSESSSPRR